MTSEQNLAVSTWFLLLRAVFLTLEWYPTFFKIVLCYENVVRFVLMQNNKLAFQEV